MSGNIIFLISDTPKTMRMVRLCKKNFKIHQNAYVRDEKESWKVSLSKLEEKKICRIFDSAELISTIEI